jgi:hypothetical protein
MEVIVSSVSKFASQAGFGLGLGLAAVIGLVSIEALWPTLADKLITEVTGPASEDSTVIEYWKKKFADEQQLREKADADKASLQQEVDKEQGDFKKVLAAADSRLKVKDDEIASLKHEKAALKLKYEKAKAKKEPSPPYTPKSSERNKELW